MNKKRKTAKLDIEALTMAAECLKALAHPHRLQIVQLLLEGELYTCLLYTSPSPRDQRGSRMPSSA